MLDLNKIYNTDCIGNKGMPLIEENSIDLIFTSPPYFNARDYSTWNTYEDYLDFLKEVFTEAFRVLKEGRMCVVNISAVIVPRENRNSESTRLAIPYHLVNIMENIGFKFLEDIVWVKPEGSAPNRNGGFFRHRKPVAYKPNNIHEFIFVFQKPFKKGGLIDKILKDYQKNKTDILEQSLVADGYERTNVWYIQPETKSKHPAPFPEELSDKVIQYYSFKEDIVLDPFSGSGTTAISSVKLGRKYIGFEIHNEYIEIFEERLKKIINE